MTNTKPGPVEVWLTQKNIEITCRIVREDESGTELEIDSLSMRGAQREITTWLIRQGYQPHGRWEAEYDARLTDGGSETVRTFRPTADAQPI